MVMTQLVRMLLVTGRPMTSLREEAASCPPAANAVAPVASKIVERARVLTADMDSRKG